MDEGKNNENELNLDFYLKHKRLTKSDRELLEAIKPIVKAVALIGGSCCEVVLHSLEDPSHSVICIENPSITKRKEGSPLTDLGIRALMKASETNMDVIGSYFTKTKDNKILKSITALIKNASGIPIGMFCINIDISAPFFAFAKDFIPETLAPQLPMKEEFISDMEEFVGTSLRKVASQITLDSHTSIRERNLQIIEELSRKNVFRIKGAVEYVAGYLGISKYTVYSYLREIKKKQIQR